LVGAETISEERLGLARGDLRPGVFEGDRAVEADGAGGAVEIGEEVAEALELVVSAGL
jgi:hypothetical protein